MFAAERQQRILEIVKAAGSVRVAELADALGIGEATVRRDLTAMERKNLLRRTHGGAMPVDSFQGELPITVREQFCQREKQIIGALAADFIQSGDIIILDSSTTAFALVPFISRIDNITVITNGLKAAMALGTCGNVSVFCTGGKIRDNSLSLVGSHAQDFFGGFAAKKLFLSCRGFSAEGGMMDNSYEEATVRQGMLQAADQVFLLCDHTKLDKKAFVTVCAGRDIDYLITDRSVPDPFAAAVRNMDIRIVTP